jgi:hypothetical protein
MVGGCLESLRAILNNCKFDEVHMICSTRSILAVALVSMFAMVSSCADKKAEEVVAPVAEAAPAAPAAEAIPEAPATAPEKAAKPVKGAKKVKKATKK